MSSLLSKLNLELQAYNDPVFFCEHVLNVKPFPKQAEILHEFYSSKKNYTNLVLVCGMRSGKTQLGAFATTYELYKLIMKGNPQAYYGLPPGQPIYILHVANSRDQAKDTIFAQTAGLLENSQWFLDHGLMERTNEFYFPQYNLFLRAEHSNSASLAGHTAKCVSEDTLIVQPDGVKQINEINMKLPIAANGKWETPRALIKHRARELIEIVCTKGHVLKVTPDHKIPILRQKIYNRPDFTKPTESMIVAAQDLLPKDIVFLDKQPEGCKSNISLEMAELLGWIVSEGSLSNIYNNKYKVSVAALRPDIRERVKYLFKHTAGKWNEDKRSIQCNSINFRKQVENYGCLSVHSSHKIIPKTIFESKNELVAAFLRAYHAGDGYACGHRIGFTTQSHMVAQGLVVLLLRFNLKPSINFNKYAGNMYDVSLHGLDACTYFEQIGFLFPSHYTTFILPIIKKQSYIRVKYTKRINAGAVYDIQVDPSHIFSANNIRVHNCVVMDETARFKDNQGKFSGDAVYFTVSRAVKTFGDEGKVLSVSSPIFMDDFQMRLYKQGKRLKQFLCYHLPTWEMNPNITREMLEPERRLNPEAFWRDFGAKPSASIEVYFRSPEKIDICIDANLPTLIENNQLMPHALPKPNNFYFLAGDPAVKNDAFGLALVHLEGEVVVTDFAFRFEQEETEINAEEVKNFIIDVANRYPLRTFVVDTWQFPETIQAVSQAGIYVKQNIVKKREYDCLKERIYTGKIKIPGNEKLIDELKSLELIRGIRIDHPRTGSKDIADALANAVWECVGGNIQKPELWRPAEGIYHKRIEPLPRIDPIDEREFHDYEIL